MKFNLGLKYDSNLDLKLNSSEFKKRCESLNIDTSIIRNSFKKRQLGLMLKNLKFKNNNDFEIRKTGDLLNPFKSGRGIINGRIIEKENNNIKPKVREKEIPPANEYSSSPKNDETYNYMSSPKLEDCTKADFDRE